MRFNVIVCDPPWSFSDKLAMSTVPRSADANYPTLNLNDIFNLQVQNIVDVDCVLALWTPSCMLVDGLALMSTWGFDFKGTYSWTKMRKDMKGPAFGMGHIFRQSHEIALIGTHGKPLKHIKNRSQRSVCLDINKGHSIKPEALQDSLDLMWTTGTKLEMFARRQRPNWVCLGNEIDGKDIRQAISEIEIL